MYLVVGCSRAYEEGGFAEVKFNTIVAVATHEVFLFELLFSPELPRSTYGFSFFPDLI